MDEQDIDPKEEMGDGIPEDIEGMMLENDDLSAEEDHLEGGFSY